tara:strand:+ start:940 stop:1650 length:711 start_codon:yes stop_codon:yes gene_type:complete
MIYCFDIDGTVCSTEQNYYKESLPDVVMIEKVNQLYDEGHTIIYFTARGSVSNVDWSIFTGSQLKKWGAKYHQLVMNKKPHFDLLVDDKCINVEEWKKRVFPKKRGFIAGSFDLMHPGYVKMWEDAKTVCDHLIVGLQTDPTMDRPSKSKPIHSIEERYLMLSAIKYIDEIVIYETEKDLYKLLKKLNLDVRILGSDYEGVKYNGHDLDIPIYFHERDHDWSATELRKKIKNEEIN